MLKIKQNVTDTKVLLKKWAESVLMDRKPSKTYSVEEFNQGNGPLVAKRYAEIEADNEKVHNFLSDSHKVLKASKGSAAWKTYQDFVNKELILFSIADCTRSIPSMCDGLKPGQRKIMFACFKRKLTQEIKVAQLSGYVAEHSAYHHGEVSLQTTIIALAQNFVGSNNINLLLPLGQFGTRNMGGKEAASARYIFT